MTTTTANGEQFLELCKAVVEASSEGEDLQSAASALVVAFIFNTMSHETMGACHRFAVKAGYDFSQGVDA